MRHHLSESGAEAGEHFPHVAAFLHADDAQVIFLVHPHQKGLVVVVPVDKTASQMTTDATVNDPRWALLTKYPGHRASRGPCQTQAAVEKLVYQTGSGHRSAAAARPLSCSSEHSTSL